jgi:hypothetical protein
MFKLILFTLHKIGIYTIPFMWLYIPNMYLLYFIIILSWKLNNNRCLITQVEYYLFNETFLGKGKKFKVPVLHRYILYGNLILSLFFLYKRVKNDKYIDINK